MPTELDNGAWPIRGIGGAPNENRLHRNAAPFGACGRADRAARTGPMRYKISFLRYKMS